MSREKPVIDVDVTELPTAPFVAVIRTEWQPDENDQAAFAELADKLKAHGAVAVIVAEPGVDFRTLDTEQLLLAGLRLADHDDVVAAHERAGLDPPPVTPDEEAGPPTDEETNAHFHGCPTPTGKPFDCDYCQERAASMEGS